MATTLTWLGHAAFRMDTEAGTRVYVDPFLNGNPTCPDAEREPERCNLVIVTHGHGDHAGDAVAIAKRFECPVVAQVELRDWLSTSEGLPEDSRQSPNKGGTVSFAGVRVTLTDANHSSSTWHNGAILYTGESTGVGLANIRDRLTQAYGAAHGFATRENDKGGFSVIIEIPYETGDKET